MKIVSFILFFSIILFTEVIVKTNFALDSVELIETTGEDTSEKHSKKPSSEYCSNFMKLSHYNYNAINTIITSSLSFSFQTFVLSQIIIEIPIPPPDFLV